MSHSLQQNEQQNFIETIKQLGNIAILLHVLNNGKPEAVYVSPEYLTMMEDTEETPSVTQNSTIALVIIEASDESAAIRMASRRFFPVRSSS